MADYRVAFFRNLVKPGLEHVDEAGSSMKSAHDNYQSQIQTLAAGRPWGNDRIGQAFDANYEISADTLVAWTELCDGLTTLAKDLWAVKAVIEEGNEEAISQFPNQ